MRRLYLGGSARTVVCLSSGKRIISRTACPAKRKVHARGDSAKPTSSDGTLRGTVFPASWKSVGAVTIPHNLLVGGSEP